MDFLLTVPYPAPFQHRLRLWSPHFLFLLAWPSLVEAALDGASVPTTSSFRSTPRSVSPLPFSFLLLSFLPSFLPSVSLLFLTECWLVGTSERVPPSNQGTKRVEESGGGVFCGS